MADLLESPKELTEHSFMVTLRRQHCVAGILSHKCRMCFVSETIMSFMAVDGTHISRNQEVEVVVSLLPITLNSSLAECLFSIHVPLSPHVLEFLVPIGFIYPPGQLLRPYGFRKSLKARGKERNVLSRLG